MKNKSNEKRMSDAEFAQKMQTIFPMLDCEYFLDDLELLAMLAASRILKDTAGVATVEQLNIIASAMGDKVSTCIKAIEKARNDFYMSGLSFDEFEAKIKAEDAIRKAAGNAR